MKKILCLELFLIVFCASARATPWNLPSTISDTNAHISFEVGSTWHLVKGKTNFVSGKAWLENLNDPKSIRASITVPVQKFDTDSENRDKRLREVMSADSFPLVKLTVQNVEKICPVESVTTDTTCPIILNSVLNIRDQSKSIRVEAILERHNDDFVISGEFNLLWADYGVEDPSILIAKLDPKVTVHFQITLLKDSAHA